MLSRLAAKCIGPILAIILLASQANALSLFDGWKTKEKASFCTYTALNVIDILQTREIWDNPEFEEMNPILTEDNYIPIMVGSNVLLYFAADMLPEKWRSWSLIGAVGLKASVVYHNHNIGVRISGSF